MRRLALLVVLAGLGLLAPTAQASFHLQTVDEVMTAVLTRRPGRSR